MIRTIHLQGPDADQAEHYGMVLVGKTLHEPRGHGWHSRSHNHRAQVWLNYTPDNGTPGKADGRFRVVLAAQPTVLAAQPTGRELSKGDPIGMGDVVELRVRYGSLGFFRVTARPYDNPELVRLSDEDAEAVSLARVTGSVGATVTRETRHADGSLSVDSAGSYSHADAEAETQAQIAAEEAERLQTLTDVRRHYGDKAADLVASGWTVNSAINHVQGVCDRALCTHPDHVTD